MELLIWESEWTPMTPYSSPSLHTEISPVAYPNHVSPHEGTMLTSSQVTCFILLSLWNSGQAHWKFSINKATSQSLNMKLLEVIQGTSRLLELHDALIKVPITVGNDSTTCRWLALQRCPFSADKYVKDQGQLGLPSVLRTLRSDLTWWLSLVFRVKEQSLSLLLPYLI